MTDTPTKIVRPRGKWKDPNLRVHTIAHLEDVLSNFTRNTGEMAEIAFEGEQPIVVKHLESDGVLIEISAAAKRGLKGGATNPFESGFSAGRMRVGELEKIFTESESPAVTTREVANKLGCDPGEASEYLIELKHRGWIDYKQSGGTTIWWAKDAFGETHDTGSQSTVENISEAIRKSDEDIKEWVEQNQREGETMKETYNRIRGQPKIDDLKRLICSTSSKHEELMGYVQEKREQDASHRDKLDEMF